LITKITLNIQVLMDINGGSKNVTKLENYYEIDIDNFISNPYVTYNNSIFFNKKKNLK